MSGGIGLFNNPMAMQQEPQQGQGLLGGFHDVIAQNQGGLLGFGLGMMSGDMGQASQSFMSGQRNDFARRQQKALQDEAIQKRTAAQALVQKYNIPAELATDADTVFGLAKSIEMQKRTPKELSFEERQFNQLNPEQQGQYRQQKFLGGEAVNWQRGTRENPDGTKSDYFYNPRNPSQIMPGPGTDATQGSSKAEVARQNELQAANIVVQDIDRALTKIDDSDVKVPVLGWDTGINTATGKAGQALQHVGGTNANNVAALTDTIKANATFDKLQQMRKSSPTGAALGAVSDADMKLLGAAIGNLEVSQDKQQIKDNLKRVKKIYNETIHGRGNVDDEGNPVGGSAKAAVQGKTKSGVSWSAQ